MTLPRGLALASALAITAGTAQAQEIGFGGNVAIVSEYIASGVTQSSGRPALQFTGYGYVPQGFYAGVFLSTVNFTKWDPTDRDRVELDLFLGWEGTIGNGLELDIGYEHYFYNRSGECCGVFYLGASSFVTERLELGLLVKYDPRAKDFDTRGTVAFYPTESVGLRAMIGRSQANSHTYMNVGLDYFFTDALTGSLDLHRATSGWTSDKVVVGLTYSF